MNATVRPRTRLFSPEAGETLFIRSDPDALALWRVLRLKAGDAAACFNGDGIEYLYRIERASRDGITFSLLSARSNPRDPSLETTVWIAASKGKCKDEIVRTLTPLGVTRIVFYQSERSVSKPEPRAADRLRKIAVESCRQCGRSTIPCVDIVDQTLQDAFGGDRESSCGILFWEETPLLPIPRLGGEGAPMDVVFGPEGGLTRDEVEWAQSHGFHTAGLGLRVLRVELAAVVGVTLIQHKRGLLGSSD